MPFHLRLPGRRAAGLTAVAGVALTLAVAPTAAVAAPTAAPTTAPTVKPVVTAGATPRVAPGHAGLPGTAGKAAAENDLTFGLRRGEFLLPQGTSTTVPSTIVSYDIPQRRDTGPQGGLGTYLVLQADGNLVEYETTTGKVLFAVGKKQGAKFVYQQDGNAVLYGTSGAALWQSGTGGDTVGQVLLSYGNGEMLIQSEGGQIAKRFGTAVTRLPGVVTYFTDSPSGRYELVVQNDGNVVAYDYSVTPAKAFFQTRTSGAGAARFASQDDGNLVLYQYPSNKVLWKSNSGSKATPAYYQLDMQDDGNIVLYRTNSAGARTTPVWQSRTGRA